MALSWGTLQGSREPRLQGIWSSPKIQAALTEFLKFRLNPSLLMEPGDGPMLQRVGNGGLVVQTTFGIGNCKVQKTFIGNLLIIFPSVALISQQSTGEGAS